MEDLNRATGRTTRQVGEYIDKLFNNPNEELQVIDHFNLALKDGEVRHEASDRALLDKIVSRFTREHLRFAGPQLRSGKRHGNYYVQLVKYLEELK